MSAVEFIGGSIKSPVRAICSDFVAVLNPFGIRLWSRLAQIEKNNSSHHFDSFADDGSV